MTEDEWKRLTSPGTRLSKVSSIVSERKRRLFAVGCCYHIWGYLTDLRSRRAVEVAEAFAEGVATREELEFAHLTAQEVPVDEFELDQRDAAQAAIASSDPDEDGSCLASDLACDASGNTVAKAQHALLDELLGNPFCPVTLDPRWRSSSVLDLANSIYDHREFERMPILADALMDAGCDSDDIIAHCRGGSKHVPGCWVIDLLLGKQ